MIDMFDTVTVASVPNAASTSRDAVAGYIDGRFNDFAAMAKRFPLDHHVSIAVFATDNADALDIEAGDALISQAPGWVRRQHARGLARPILYIQLSNLQALLDTLRNAGIDRQAVRIWMAHYTFDRNTGVSELAAHAVDAVQWTDKYEGRNLDASVLVDDFFALKLPAHKPAPKRHPAKKVAKKVKAAAKKTKPHPKVAAAGIAGVLSTALVSYLNSHGVSVTHLNPQEQDVLVLASTLLAAWIKPS